MKDEKQPTPVANPRARVNELALLWAGWVLTVLPSLLLIMSSVMKLVQPKEVVAGFKEFGYSESLLLPIGIVELACTILYLFPRTSVLGAILLTGYLGGATVTHVRAEDGFQFVFPVILGMVVWLGLFLRDARLRALLPLRS
jgi:hypothetical protein